MRRLLWSAQAQLDLALIDDQLFVEDPDFANRVALSAVYSARFLPDWPSAGATICENAHSKWPIKKTPYILIYSPDKTDVSILRVYHERQDRGVMP